MGKQEQKEPQRLTERIEFRVSPEMMTAVEAIARRYKMSQADVGRMAVAELVEAENSRK